MHFIKSIFSESKVPEYVHNKFTRYGKGEFTGPFVDIKKSKSFFEIKGSVDYVEVVGRIIAKNATTPLNISGRIFTKRKDMKEKILPYLNIKKFKEGLLSVYEIEKGSYEKDKLSKIYDEIQDGYLIFEISSEDGKFSIKPKKNLPKPGKEDNNFFSARLDFSAEADIVEEIAFDIKKNSWNEIKISHKYIIKELVVPEELKKNYKEARIVAKRKGTIKRFLEVDNKKEEKEKEFLV